MIGDYVDKWMINKDIAQARSIPCYKPQNRNLWMANVTILVSNIAKLDSEVMMSSKV